MHIECLKHSGHLIGGHSRPDMYALADAHARGLFLQHAFHRPVANKHGLAVIGQTRQGLDGGEQSLGLNQATTETQRERRTRRAQ